MQLSGIFLYLIGYAVFLTQRRSINSVMQARFCHHIHMLDSSHLATQINGAVMRCNSNLTLEQQPAKRHQKHQKMFFEETQAISPVGVHIGIVRLKKVA